MESEHNYLQTFADYVDLAGDLLTVIASGIAIWIFITQREKISSAFSLLLRFSLQITLAELFNKIEKLNEFDADDPGHASTVLNLLKEIEGQIKGNRFLRVELADLLVELKAFTSKPTKIVEANKRSLVYELRESLRDIDVSRYNKIIK